MNKIKIVAKFEILRQLKKRSFWISLLLFPVLILGLLGISTLSSSSIDSSISDQNFEGKKIGLTDDANILGKSADLFEKVDSEEEGKRKVLSGELDIYYHVAEDFSDSKKVKIFDRASDMGLFSFNQIPFSAIMKSEVYSKLKDDEIAMIEGSMDFENIDLDEDGNQISILGRAIIPLGILATFYVLICVFGNRLTLSLVEEKENRISELILTSVSSKNFVVGKIISLIAIGFIQIFVFILPILVVLLVFRDSPLLAPILATVDFAPLPIIENILLLLFSYFVFAGGCTFISSLCPTARDASQYVGVIMIPMILPLLLMNNFISGDMNLLTYVMTYFPLSAPIALMLRNAFGNLPSYELLIGIIELCLASVLVLVLTVKSFQKNAINFSVVKPKLKIKSFSRH